MHHLSAVIITYNEEKNITRCIKALKEVADEILIIDNFSTDQTVQISHNLGARIIQKTWSGFGPQKQYGVEQALYNNIIALDADEVLDQTAITNILSLKEYGFEAVYEICLHHYYFGKFLKYGQERPNYKKRIFNREKVSWNSNKVHESLIIPAGYPVLKIKGRINHYSYNSIQQYISKSNLYTTIAAEQMFQNGRHNYSFKIIVSPSFTFFKSYIIKMGILDGAHGFIIAMLNGYSNFLKYIKLWELIRNNKRVGNGK